ncbi:hypothetical protein GCM10010300_55930 [Streptomyces olivaceoviridis]|uniref:integral membrane transport protein n=1 Tax=Streptomyces olivaceoviridis TaxID=1921 RepID=UPI0019831FBE|nr:integral membrane transport protein [Streptomyces olivaceoviridis]GGZ04813.1 hypothetical protein GCM10010300_55930 [Streptomyces olivaceoviridis]
MSAVTETAPVAAPGNPVGRSVRDSLVIARRNLIRMGRIPDCVRSYRSGSILPRAWDLRVSGLETWKEQAK